MAGNRAGGLKCAAKNKANDPDFYKKIGSVGGSKSGEKGFKLDRELARRVGKIGGTISRRTGVANGEGKSKRRKRNENGQ